MMLYTMFNGTRLEASIANFTGGYMEICQWLIGNGNNWLIYIGMNSVNIVCVHHAFRIFQMSFLQGTHVYPMHFQVIFLINTGDVSKPPKGPLPLHEN